MKTPLPLLVAASLFAPLAPAHAPALTPVPHCGLSVAHDWVLPGAAGVVEGSRSDLGAGSVLDGALDDCDADGMTPDHDGDLEWGLGAAVFAVSGGDGVTLGSLACYRMPAHHAWDVIHVEDAIIGPAPFVVAADASRGPPSSYPDCGDGLIEPCAPLPPASRPPGEAGALKDLLKTTLHAVFNTGAGCNPLDGAQACFGACAVPFPPGADGAFWVFPGAVLAVDGLSSTSFTTPLSFGHAWSGSHPSTAFHPWGGWGDKLVAAKALRVVGP